MITIVMPLYNDEKYVKDAVSAILNQTHKNFELLIIDDGSTDKSLEIVKSFRDKRIKIYKNDKNVGVAGIRNKGIKLAKGKYIFFTDSDCISDKNWLKKGVETFENNNCLGVEGQTYYIKKGYTPHISDKMPGSVDDEEQYLGCNIGFRKETFEKIGLYDRKNYEGYHEDRDFALRVLKVGKILKNKEMVITHQKKLWNVKSYLKSSKRASYRVRLYKDHHDTAGIYHKIIFPKNLLKIFFPPLILITLFKHKNKTLLDYKIIFASYLFCIMQRFYIWKAAIKQGVFLI